ncbi:hypothetical protein GCM10022243_43090 [Saccharothrix violaceirubra]|uniref:HAF family extracellular repeat protein n=1 Tax=Saccharothrix violaceirubra TaxID=413306 RepID=A0A7W7WW48_9PSEU|nr:hypothetical protein [Saccharothrix violaceirubra]MBB4965597.1 hypothetical protein [Saccharothrix violaceirubra]
MRRGVSTVATAVVLLCGSQVVAVAAGAVAVPLEPPPGNTWTWLAGIDDTGTILGQSRYDPAWPRTVVWPPTGGFRELGEGDPVAVSRDGRVLWQDRAGRALVWQRGTTVEIPKPATARDVGPNAINSAGDVVLAYREPGQDEWENVGVARQGRFRVLEFPSDDALGLADLITDDGTVYGRLAFDGGRDRPVRCGRDGVCRWLPLPPGVGSATVSSANDEYAVGTGDRDGWSVPLRWQGNTVVRLPTGDSPGGVATSVNRAGDVAGSTTRPDGTPHAVLWRHGALVDFDGYDKPSGAVAINERGQVLVSRGRYDEPRRSYVWHAGTFVELPALAPGEGAEAAGFNNTGTAYGVSVAPDGKRRPTRWTFP